MEKLIADINKLGYNVQLYQYGNWLNNTAGRWEACATTADGKMMVYFTFKQTPLAALQGLKDRIVACKEQDKKILEERAHAERAAAQQGSGATAPAQKTKDPFDWEDEEDALS